VRLWLIVREIDEVDKESTLKPVLDSALAVITPLVGKDSYFVDNSWSKNDEGDGIKGQLCCPALPIGAAALQSEGLAVSLGWRGVSIGLMHAVQPDPSGAASTRLHGPPTTASTGHTPSARVHGPSALVAAVAPAGAADEEDVDGEEVYDDFAGDEGDDDDDESDEDNDDDAIAAGVTPLWRTRSSTMAYHELDPGSLFSDDNAEDRLAAHARPRKLSSPSTF
jgi:hypothetical protein